MNTHNELQTITFGLMKICYPDEVENIMDRIKSIVLALDNLMKHYGFKGETQESLLFAVIGAMETGILNEWTKLKD